MASRRLLSPSRPELFVCSQCAFRAARPPVTTARRSIGMKYLSKVADAEMAWQDKAFDILAGKRKSMLTILEERGLIHQMTGDRAELDELLTKKRIGAYCGIDPTAPSLHVGHLLPFMCLYWLYFHGYHTVALIGGATAKIGDPTGRTKDRELPEKHIQAANLANMHYQMKKLWLNVEKHGVKHGYKWEWAWHRELENNNQWMNKLTMLELLQVLGHGVRLGAMLSRDTVKNKMASADGMSFAEFTYPIMQAWDWWHMYKTKGVHIQIGGSDQYGNIVAGLNAVKHISAHHPDPSMRGDKGNTGTPPFGWTVPLLTTASGQKFGKSAGNAVWLSKDMTSTFDLYGYFVRQADADMPKLLRLFTFMPLAEIDALMAAHAADPAKRQAQHRLAREVVEMVHGEADAQHAEAQHRLMYGGASALSTMKPAAPPHEYRERPAASKILDANYPQPIITLNDAPDINIQLPASLIFHKSIGKILHAAGLVRSAQEGHRLAAQQGAWVGGMPGGAKQAMSDAALTFTPIKLWFPAETRKFLINDRLLILRRGKHNVRIIEVVDDAAWASSGQTYPGEIVERDVDPDTGKTRKTRAPGNDGADEVVSRSAARQQLKDDAKARERDIRAAEYEVRALRRQGVEERLEKSGMSREEAVREAARIMKGDEEEEMK